MAVLNDSPIDRNLRLLLIPKEKKPTPEKKDQNYKTNQKITLIAAAAFCAALFGIVLVQGFLLSREVSEPYLPFSRIDYEIPDKDISLTRQLCQYTEDLCKKGLVTLEKCTAFGQKCLNLEFHEEIRSLCKEIAENRCVDIEGKKVCLKEILSKLFPPTVYKMSATEVTCDLHLDKEYDPKLFDGVYKDFYGANIHFFTAELPKKITDYFSLKFNEFFPQTEISWDSLKLKLEVDNTLAFYQNNAVKPVK